MLLKMKKAIVAFVVMATSASVAFAACGGTEALVNIASGKMAASLVAKITAQAATVVAADNLQTQQMISALRVIAKQVEASNSQFVNSSIEGEKAMASVHKDLTDKELIDKMVVDFVSQGYDPCAQSAATKKLALAEQAMHTSVPERVRGEVEAGGGKYAPIADVLRNREKQHQSLFCTQEEVEAGACSSVGKVPGGDTNAALIFSASKAPEMVAAKNAVINNIIGLPDNPMSPAVAATPEGQAYIMEKKKKDSFLGFASHSLKSIQAENEVYKTEMDDRVGQFFGTDRAALWAKDQAGQAPRGVLVDLLKIQGLNLKVRERRIRQNMRIEANMAALLELENQQINGAVTQSAARQVGAIDAAKKVK